MIQKKSTTVLLFAVVSAVIIGVMFANCNAEVDNKDMDNDLEKSNDKQELVDLYNNALKGSSIKIDKDLFESHFQYDRQADDSQTNCDSKKNSKIEFFDQFIDKYNDLLDSASAIMDHVDGIMNKIKNVESYTKSIEDNKPAIMKQIALSEKSIQSSSFFACFDIEMELDSVSTMAIIRSMVSIPVSLSKKMDSKTELSHWYDSESPDLTELQSILNNQKTTNEILNFIYSCSLEPLNKPLDGSIINLTSDLNALSNLVYIATVIYNSVYTESASNLNDTISTINSFIKSAKSIRDQINFIPLVNERFNVKEVGKLYIDLQNSFELLQDNYDSIELPKIVIFDRKLYEETILKELMNIKNIKPSDKSDFNISELNLPKTLGTIRNILGNFKIDNIHDKNKSAYLFKNLYINEFDKVGFSEDLDYILIISKLFKEDEVFSFLQKNCSGLTELNVFSHDLCLGPVSNMRDIIEIASIYNMMFNDGVTYKVNFCNIYNMASCISLFISETYNISIQKFRCLDHIDDNYQLKSIEQIKLVLCLYTKMLKNASPIIKTVLDIHVDIYDEVLKKTENEFEKCCEIFRNKQRKLSHGELKAIESRKEFLEKCKFKMPLKEVIKLTNKFFDESKLSELCVEYAKDNALLIEDLVLSTYNLDYLAYEYREADCYNRISNLIRSTIEEVKKYDLEKRTNHFELIELLVDYKEVLEYICKDDCKYGSPIQKENLPTNIREIIQKHNKLGKNIFSLYRLHYVCIDLLNTYYSKNKSCIGNLQYEKEGQKKLNSEQKQYDNLKDSAENRVLLLLAEYKRYIQTDSYYYWQFYQYWIPYLIKNYNQAEKQTVKEAIDAMKDEKNLFYQHHDSTPQVYEALKCSSISDYREENILPTSNVISFLEININRNPSKRIANELNLDVQSYLEKIFLWIDKIENSKEEILFLLKQIRIPDSFNIKDISKTKKILNKGNIPYDYTDESLAYLHKIYKYLEYLLDNDNIEYKKDLEVLNKNPIHQFFTTKEEMQEFLEKARQKLWEAKLKSSYKELYFIDYIDGKNSAPDWVVYILKNTNAEEQYKKEKQERIKRENEEKDRLFKQKRAAMTEKEKEREDEIFKQAATYYNNRPYLDNDDW